MTRRAYAALGLLGLALAGGIAAALVLAFSPGGAREPTRAAYLAQVSSICTRYGRRLDGIPPPRDPTLYAEVVSSIGGALPVLRAEAAAIRALRPPAALKARVDRLLALNDRSLQALAQALAAAKRNDSVATARSLVRFAAVRDKSKALSRALVFRC